jgi:hypothetical protein
MFIHLWLLMSLGASAIYLFPSGYPQICDALFLAFIASVVWRVISSRWQVANETFIFVWMMLVLWVSVVNLTWVLVYQASSHEIAYLMLWPPLFYWYNFLVGLALLVYLRKSDIGLKVVVCGVSASLFISAIGILLGVTKQARVTAFFNNPNQLAHFCLCGLAILLIAYGGRIPIRLLPLAAVAAGILGVLAPASLAAIGGLLVIGIGWAIANLHQLRRMLQATAAALILFGAMFGFDQYKGGGIAESLMKRAGVSEKKVSELTDGARGYDRLLAYPKHLILGAGEGAWPLRFQPYHQGVEIHSSLGTLLFCYGSIGVMLFVVLLFHVMKSSPPFVSVVISGLLLYGFTHNGLRTTFFWIVLVAAWAKYGNNSRSVTAV